MHVSPFRARFVDGTWTIVLLATGRVGRVVFGARQPTAWQKLRAIPASEDGAAYTLSYVMVVPLFMWLICLIVETTLMLTAKVGADYAAFAAARTAVVWSSAADAATAKGKVEFAAVKTFAPFASGMRTLDAVGAATREGAIYQAAYREYSKKPASLKYMAAKFGYAKKVLKVTTNGAPSNWDSDITVTVEYDFPFNVPGVGRLLGRRGADGRFYYRIKATATLQNEGPQNDDQSLGIGYGTFN